MHHSRYSCVACSISWAYEYGSLELRRGGVEGRDARPRVSKSGRSVPDKPLGSQPKTLNYSGRVQTKLARAPNPAQNNYATFFTPRNETYFPSFFYFSLCARASFV